MVFYNIQMLNFCNHFLFVFYYFNIVKLINFIIMQMLTVTFSQEIAWESFPSYIYNYQILNKNGPYKNPNKIPSHLNHSSAWKQ